jgi:glycosyltransferase involved in cell wall biosynthesis
VPDVILPALDEAAAIPGVLGGLPDGYNAIVVDNGSTDRTASLAAARGARVVIEPQRGFGAACWAGLQAATSDVVCFMDCDGSFLGSDLSRVAAPVLAGDADLALGARVAARGVWPAHLRLGNRYVAHQLGRRARVRVRDLGPMRAARRDALLALGLVDRRFGWPLEMVLRAAQHEWRITEVDVTYMPRVGQSKVTGTFRGALRTARDMRRVLHGAELQQP